MAQKGQSKDNRCRVGCRAVEEMHHIFIVCPEYVKLRESARDELVKKTYAHLKAMEIEETLMMGLLTKAKSFFINCEFTWLLHYFFYYLGHVPPLDSLVPLDAFKRQALYT